MDGVSSLEVGAKSIFSEDVAQRYIAPNSQFNQIHPFKRLYEFNSDFKQLCGVHSLKAARKASEAFQNN